MDGKKLNILSTEVIKVVFFRKSEGKMDKYLDSLYFFFQTKTFSWKIASPSLFSVPKSVCLSLERKLVFVAHVGILNKTKWQSWRQNGEELLLVTALGRIWASCCLSVGSFLWEPCEDASEPDPSWDMWWWWSSGAITLQLRKIVWSWPFGRYRLPLSFWERQSESGKWHLLDRLFW